jgi:hypothetical protein
MKYAVEMGSIVMICVPSIIKIGSGIYADTQSGWKSHRPTLGK